MVLRGALRLGMVTTCPPKARDGHHMSAKALGLGDPTWAMPFGQHPRLLYIGA